MDRPQDPAATERRVERRLALAAFVVAALTVHGAFAGYEQRILALCRALEAGRLWIDPDAGLTIDRAIDPVTGHVYSGGSPGLAVALLPVHAVVTRLPLPDVVERALLVCAAAAAPFALGVVAVRRAARRAGADANAATTAAAAHAFGTIALAFGARLYGHALAVALLAGGLALTLRRAPGDPTTGDDEGDAGRHPAATPASWAAAGACAALAVTVDYGVVVAAGALLVVTLLRSARPDWLRNGGWFVLGAVPAALALAAYHTVCFGAPWRTPYDLHADAQIADLMASSYGYRLPRPGIVAELLFGLRRGVLFTQPIVFVGALGLTLCARASRVHALALGVGVVALLMNAARVHDWDAGTSFGARYLACALPWMALGYARGLQALGRAGPWVLTASVALAALGPTTSWGSVQLSLESLLLLGPTAGGLCALTLGRDPASEPMLTTTLVSALGLCAAAPLALLLVQPRARPTLLVVAVAAPLVLAGPSLRAWLTLGRAGVMRERGELVRRQVRRDIERCDDVANARRLVSIVGHLRDPALSLLALDRLVALAPDDAEARALRDRLAASVADVGSGAR